MLTEEPCLAHYAKDEKKTWLKRMQVKPDSEYIMTKTRQRGDQTDCIRQQRDLLSYFNNVFPLGFPSVFEPEVQFLQLF